MEIFKIPANPSMWESLPERKTHVLDVGHTVSIVCKQGNDKSDPQENGEYDTSSFFSLWCISGADNRDDGEGGIQPRKNYLQNRGELGIERLAPPYQEAMEHAQQENQDRKCHMHFGKRDKD
jgi:hypothetical protein